MNKIDPWGTQLIEDYSRLIKDFGLEPMQDFLLDFPRPNYLMKRGIVFGGQGLKELSAAMKEKKPFYCLTGIMPSSERIHFGTKTVIEMVKYFQENNAKTFVLVADLESAATTGISLKEARERAMDFYIPAYIALGLNPKKTVFYFQSENSEVKNLAYLFSQKITLNEFKSIYGEVHPSRILSALAQAGDILFPQLNEKMPGVIPVGIDQSPHIRLARDIVRRTKSEFNFFLPSATYHKFVPSLDGSNKMSKSNPNSFVSIPEESNSAGKKMKKALTGGRNTVEEQKKLGGQPENCMIFEMYKQHLIEDDKKLQQIYDNCKAGKLLCGQDKDNAFELMISFQEDFKKKLENARKTRKQWKFVKS